MRGRFAFCALVVACVATSAVHAQLARGISDRDIVEAYEYMLGRLLVLRQENLDFKEGLKWNQIIHREPGGVDWANPNLDVAYSEAWVAVDDKSCTLIELPEIKGRYYTVQALNGWGEVTANHQRAQFSQTPVRQIRLLSEGYQGNAPKGHAARQFAQQEVADPDAD